MACFIVPATEAVVTTIITKKLEKKEAQGQPVEKPFSVELKRLNHLLWGGSALLALEHVWHGEISPIFPFLTALRDSADTLVMFHEMATVGVTMALTVTTLWAVHAFLSAPVKSFLSTVFKSKKSLKL